MYVAVVGPARAAAAKLVDGLREMGRLEAIDESMCEVAELLGAAVDADPTNASLWGQFRAALDDLRQVGSSGDDDDLANLLASLAAVPDPEEPEPADSRPAGRKGRGGDGAAVHATSAADRRRGRGAAS